jgi:hypothetical protein
MLVHYLVLEEFSDVLTADAMHMGSVELTNGPPTERMNISTSNETNCLARSSVDVIGHGQTLGATYDNAGILSAFKNERLSAPAIAPGNVMPTLSL